MTTSFFLSVSLFFGGEGSIKIASRTMQTLFDYRGCRGIFFALFMFLYYQILGSLVDCTKKYGNWYIYPTFLAYGNPKMLVETHRKVIKAANLVYTMLLTTKQDRYNKSICFSLRLLAVLGSQSIVVKQTATIFD